MSESKHLQLASKGQEVSALDSLDGSRIFVGTNDGHVFTASPSVAALDPPASAAEMIVAVRASAPGRIWRIRSESLDNAYAVFNQNSPACFTWSPITMAQVDLSILAAGGVRFGGRS